MTPPRAEIRDQARVLWIALVANFAMFIVEVSVSFAADSVSLRADAIDFLGDSANYALSLIVLARPTATKARASLLKAFVTAGFGFWVLGSVALHLARGTVPEAAAMGVVGLLALAVNLGVAAMLYRHRGGDSNMLSAWLCSRNDAAQNLAVMVAAGLVYFTRAGWPDLAVAAGLGGMALQAAWVLGRRAKGEVFFIGRG